MSVDDRLRRGLGANAAALVPEGELRLAAVHRRHRRRSAVLATAVAAAVVVVVVGAGVLVARTGAGDDPPAPPVVTEPTSAAPSTGRQVPDSSWTRVATAAEARRLGVPRDAAVELLGDDGRLFQVLTFRNGSFSQSGRYGSGVMEVGDLGSVSYSGGRLVLTSSSPGCPGCVASFRWRLLGDRLVLDRMSGTDVRPLDRLVYEGTWERRDR